MISKQSGRFSRRSGRFPNSQENFRTVWTISGESWRFPDSLEDFQTGWKIFGQSWKFLDFPEILENVSDSLEDFQTFWIGIFRTIWMISRLPAKVLDSLEKFQQSGRFPDSIEGDKTVWWFSRQFEQFPDSLEYVPDNLENVVDSLENFCTVQNFLVSPRI